MTRARDIAGGTIFTSADNTKLDGIATGATAYVHPTGAGNQHVPAAGAAGQLLQYASAGTAAWATISTGSPDISFPNWASPNNTYATSGTWSKGSLEDTDLVFFLLVAGGYGGGKGSTSARAGWSGGACMLLGPAGVFDGCAYVIGAGAAGSSNYDKVQGGHTTVTLSSSNGSTVFTSASQNYQTVAPRVADDFVNGATNSPYSLTPITYPATVNGVTYQSDGLSHAYATTSLNVVFGGGQGSGLANYSGGQYTTGTLGNSQTSLFSGNGGTGNGGHGVYPGGGGASNTTSGAAGNGANGNLRVYHV